MENRCVKSSVKIDYRSVLEPFIFQYIDLLVRIFVRSSPTVQKPADDSGLISTCYEVEHRKTSAGAATTG